MTKNKQSTFDRLIKIFKNNIKTIKDERRQRSNIKYNFNDIILGAFSIFYFQNVSWLSFQRKLKDIKGKDNAMNIFGINIPIENHIKNILDKINPNNFSSIYNDLLLKCDKIGIIKQFTFMEKYLLVAIDGVSYHSSKKINCKCCQRKKDRKTGDISYFHVAITPTIVHPKLKKVIALFQEFISNEDGDKSEYKKQDCEVNASKRWLDKFNIFIFLQKQYEVIILGDDLYSRFPMIKKILEKSHSFILVCKEKSHKVLYKSIEAYKRANSCNTFEISKIHNGKKQIWTYSWINNLLLNGNNTDNIEINWCELVIVNLEGRRLHCFSFVSNINISRSNIEDIILGGRTRWKVENENNNTLKTKGYNLSHNYGHGKQYLSQNLCSLNVLAFLFHTIQEFDDENYIKLREKIGTRKEFFQSIVSLTTMFVVKDFDRMIEFILLSRIGEDRVDVGEYLEL